MASVYILILPSDLFGLHFLLIFSFVFDQKRYEIKYKSSMHNGKSNYDLLFTWTRSYFYLKAFLFSRNVKKDNLRTHVC